MNELWRAGGLWPGVLFGVTWLLGALLCLPAAAQTRSAERQAVYSRYEAESIELALRELNAELDPAPDGKWIEHVEIRNLDVFERRDPLPGFLNWFHATTRQRVIERELLFGAGEAYEPSRIEESARNLRELRQLSVVLIVAYRGSAPDRVRVLVITKDVWSLRLNWSIEADNAVITRFLVQPSEENLLGTHATLGGLFILSPDTYSVGGVFAHSRLFGSRIQTMVNANVLLNRDTGESEGTRGFVYYGQPLYSRATRWAWETVLIWQDQMTRRFRRGRARVFDARSSDERGEPCRGRCVPYEYRTDFVFGSYEVTRSFGRDDKLDLTAGWEAQRGVYDVDSLSEYDPAAVARFREHEVPRDDQRIGPVLQLRARSTRYLRTINLGTLGLQEDFQLGHDLWLRVYPTSSGLGSTRDMLGTFAAMGYTLPLGNGLARAYASHTLEYAGAQQSDATLQLRSFVASPRFALGRVVHGARLTHQYRDYTNDRLDVGGDTRPRGYPAGEFIGRDVVSSSLELRTLPLEILSAQAGAVLFYDVADAFDGFADMTLHQSAGLGFRGLFPWLDRTVFRVDWGVPLDDGPDWPGGFFISFEQALPVPAILPPTPAATIRAPQQQ